MAQQQLIIRSSSIERTILCPSWVRLSAPLPPTESGEAAKVGTAIHALAEKCYKEEIDPLTFEGLTFDGVKMTQDHCEFALAHLKAIWSIEDELGADNVFVEKFLLYQERNTHKVQGTADVLAFGNRKLIVADLKTGRGYVDQDNDQLKLYALAAMESMKLYQRISEIELWIIQPHHGEIRKHQMTVQELVDWEHYILTPAIENALNPAYPPMASDKACQYCPAKTICPAQRAIIETVSNAPPIEMLSEAQIGMLLLKFDMVEDYIKAVKESAVKRMEKGAVIPGWQLAPKKALRSWNSEEEAIKHLQFLGLGIQDITKTELISPAQAEKLLPKGLKESIEPLTSRISSGLTLARDKSISA